MGLRLSLRFVIDIGIEVKTGMGWDWDGIKGITTGISEKRWDGWDGTGLRLGSHMGWMRWDGINAHSVMNGIRGIGLG